MMKHAVNILAGLFVIFAGTFLTAEIFYQDCLTKAAKKDTRGALKSIDIAILCNPFNSIYVYKKYDIQKSDPGNQRMVPLRRAIYLETTCAKYHMYFALELLRDKNKRSRVSDRLALHELKRAKELKPFSKQFDGIYEKYRKSLLGAS